MKNYISYRPGRERGREFRFFDDDDVDDCLDALELAERMRGAVFLRPDSETGWADWKGVPQIRGERLAYAEDA